MSVVYTFRVYRYVLKHSLCAMLHFNRRDSKPQGQFSDVSTGSAYPTRATERMGSTAAALNEINFTLGPADTSLSRCYKTSHNSAVPRGAPVCPEPLSDTGSQHGVELQRATHPALPLVAQRGGAEPEFEDSDDTSEEGGR